MAGNTKGLDIAVYVLATQGKGPNMVDLDVRRSESATTAATADIGSAVNGTTGPSGSVTRGKSAAAAIESYGHRTAFHEAPTSD